VRGAGVSSPLRHRNNYRMNLFFLAGKAYRG